MKNVETAVRQFILEKYILGQDAAQLTPELPLLETGVLDSISIFEMVTFAETRFDVVIEDTEILPENFNSIASIAALISRKLPAA